MWAIIKNRLAKIKNSLKEHQAPIGGALIAFGGTYQIMNALLWGWWNPGIIDSITGPTFQQQVSLALGFLAEPLFYLTTVLIIAGVAVIWKQNMPPGPSVNLKESWKAYRRITLGILLTTFGFTYQVIGAWVLWDKAYPWSWQTEIAKYGALLVWPLFILSLLALIAGATLLYQDSKLRKIH